jgi:DNA-binding NarL/FixJ family response regulator
LIARGLSNREISAALVITEKTVGSHVEHIMTKLGLRSRTRIAVWAIEHGMGANNSD